MIALFFDTETTGFPSEDFSPEIVQIGSILQDTETRQVLGVLSHLIVPLGDIPAETTAIHGITKDITLKYGLGKRAGMLAFMDLLCNTQMVVAHNLKFDMEILRLNWPEAFSIASSRIQYDTMLEARMIMNLPPGKYHGSYTEGPKPPRLSEAVEHFTGKPIVGAHDALSDAGHCRDVYFGIQAIQRAT
jgi:DNA polymerase-3 subunit epsilon